MHSPLASARSLSILRYCPLRVTPLVSVPMPDCSPPPFASYLTGSRLQSFKQVIFLVTLKSPSDPPFRLTFSVVFIKHFLHTVLLHLEDRSFCLSRSGSLFRKDFSVCEHVCLHAFMYPAYVQVPFKDRRHQIPHSFLYRQTWATCGCWKLNAGPQPEQSVLLTMESFLQPQIEFSRCLRETQNTSYSEYKSGSWRPNRLPLPPMGFQGAMAEARHLGDTTFTFPIS